MTNFERAWAKQKRFVLNDKPTEPPALPIDIVIAVFAVGIFLGSLIV